MSTGQECVLAMPEPHDLSMIRHSAIVEVCACTSSVTLCIHCLPPVTVVIFIQCDMYLQHGWWVRGRRWEALAPLGFAATLLVGILTKSLG